MILRGDAAKIPLADKSVQCCVTSPPYWGLRSYGFKKDDPARLKMIGLEPTFDRHLWNLVRVFREVRRVLRDDGTLWLVYGDSYEGGGRGGNPTESHHPKQATNVGSLLPPSPSTGLAAKQLIGMAWRVALALQADGWILRSDIIWAKRSPMPESVRDRPTKAHEYVFLFTKSPRYFYDQEAGREKATFPGGGNMPPNLHAPSREDVPGDGKFERQSETNRRLVSERNMRSVWTLSTEPTRDAHFATFPTELVARCLKPGTSAKGCCSTCGAPWKRIAERETIYRDRPNEYVKRREQDDRATGNRINLTREGVSVSTVGWRPGCDHDAEPVPCRVLDPFAGSGTVGVVCRRMGLNFVGIELNAEYCQMSRRRIGRSMQEYAPEVPQMKGQLELIA